MKIKDYYQPESPPGMAPLATRAGDLVFFGGGIAAHPVKGIPEELKPRLGYPYHWSNINRQLRYIFDNVRAVAEDAGSSTLQLMKINTYLTDPNHVYETLTMRKDYVGVETPPPSTLVLVPELPVKGALVTMDCTMLALNSPLKREALFTSTPQAPMPPHERIWGHRIYVKACRGGGFIFTSGRTNNVIGGKTDEKSIGHSDFPYRDYKSVIAAEMILDYERAVLQEMGASLQDVVRVDVHLNNMKHLAGLEEVWLRYFPDNPPSRVLIPADFPNEFSLFEMEVVAIDPKGPYRKEIVTTDATPRPQSHEPQAVKAGPYLFLSEQLATDWRQGLAPEARVDPNFPYHTSSAKKQAKYILKNVEAICRAAGTSAQKLVRRRALHCDLNELAEAESAWKEVLVDRLPPTTVIRTAGQLPVPGCSVGYDLVAFIE